ncbi:MAG: pentapeptide repeat-containing protein [Oculatellaceae cyanobacterium bins.114]|nr:pentapeptide repeat-containing protein [Oculatellaceae cyanobacterium bins.114]
MKPFRVLVLTLIVFTILQADVSFKLLLLRFTKYCPNCRLVGAEIKNVDLEGANLRNADLRWAALSSVNLNNADLSGANLRYAQLNEVSVQNTNFCHAILMDSVQGYCHP